MGADALSERDNWQSVSVENAQSKEKKFISICQEMFEGTEFRIHEKPLDFKTAYSSVTLADEVQKRIYSPPKIGEWGFIPDFSIENTSNGKTIYGDNKKQDGWIEGLSSNVGRGNAHERLNKYFAPGVMKLLHTKSNLAEGILPFWIVFEGNITRDPKRVREISCWFEGHQNHFFMWDSSPDSDLLIAHFNDKIKPLLL